MCRRPSKKFPESRTEYEEAFYFHAISVPARHGSLTICPENDVDRKKGLVASENKRFCIEWVGTVNGCASLSDHPGSLKME
jgi:hypothetical protein